MKKFSLIALIVLAVALLATILYLLIERQSGGEVKSCSVNSDCDNGYYCVLSTNTCHPFIDRHGNTPIGASGANGGLMADMTADNFDDDGDGFCETAPCVGSLSPFFQVNELRGGDCDDNPSDDGFSFTVGSDSGIIKTDGSWSNNPDSTDWKGDGFDNNCDGVVHPDSDRFHFQDFGGEDGLPRILDNCPTISNPDQSDMDKDGIGDQCDMDCNGNGVREVLGEFEFPNLNCSSPTQ